MEALAAMGAIIVEGCCNSITKFICGRITTLVNVQSNIQSLHNEMEKLVSYMNIIKEDIEQAESQRKSPPSEVKVWLKKGEEMELQVELMLEADLGSGCHVCHRYKLGKAVKKKCLEVRRLADSCTFPVIFVDRKSPVKAVEKMQAQSLAGQKAAEDMLSRLMECLKDDHVKRVAIWGMGGVGKTTLVKNFNNMIESSSALSGLVDLLIWVKVSKNVDVKKIQSDIADRLNLRFLAEEGPHQRANRLFRRLVAMKFILILDDVWEKLDLEAIGVPKSHEQVNCKIIITTRRLDVCREMMTDVQFKVDVLNEERSWRLFVENAGEAAELKDIESLARAVAKECCGLPLAIKTVARSMREKTMKELWDDALNRLRRSTPHFESIEKEVYIPLRLSYDSLPSKILKYCFLYCSLYPENFSIQVSELIQCWIAEGLINQYQTLEQSFNSGTGLIEHLKDCCLLEPGEVVGTIRMHDVVRDVAIWISTYEVETGFFCQPGVSLPGIVPHKLERSFKRVSFMDNSITRLPNKLSGCSELTVLFLQGNPIDKVPDGFFRDVGILRVLNLSNTRIALLPSSLFLLGDLRALFLRDCPYLKDLPSLEALHELQVLDLSGTWLRQLPKEVGKLRNLRELDLSRTHHLKEIESGAISGLSSLESLDMSCSSYKFFEAPFNELLSLKLLSALHITFDPFDCKALRFDWLRSLRKFSIWITPTICHSTYPPTQNDEKRVILHKVDLLDSGLEGLLCSASALDLITCGGINGLSEIISKTCLYGLPNLKSLTITSCDWIKNLINGEEIRGSMLPNLEGLALHGLVNLETILEGDVPKEGFLAKLRKIEVSDCPRLRGLVSYTLLKQVRNLEEIRVTNCKRMKWVFPGSVPGQVRKKLRGVELKDLVSLRFICSRTPAWSVLERIEVSNCPMLEKLPLSGRNVITLNEIRGDLGWWDGLAWDDYETKAALQRLFQPCATPLRPMIQEDE